MVTGASASSGGRAPRSPDGIVTHVERRPVDVELALRAVGGVRRRARGGRAGSRSRSRPPTTARTPSSSRTRSSCSGGLAVIDAAGRGVAPAELAGAEAAVARARLSRSRGSRRRARSTAATCSPSATRSTSARAAGRTARARASSAPCSAHGGASRCPSRGVLHLKSAVTALPDGTIVGYPPLAPDPALFPALPGRSGAVGRARRRRSASARVLLAADCPRSAELFAVARLRPGRRRHRRVPEARGLRDLPVGARSAP